MSPAIGETVETNLMSRIAHGLRTVAFALPALAALASLPAGAQTNVTMGHNDIGRTGQNLNETILTPANVNPTQFGKLFAQPVDGLVFAQPLYLSGVSVNGTTHNVVYVATENDSVYAFDADTNGGANSSPLWKASMLTAAHGAAAGATTVSSRVVGYDIQPQIGITGTPVIDPVSGTLYVVSASWENSTSVQRLHALDVTSGAEKFGGPVVITATIPGTGNGSVNGSLTFDPTWENQRPGLLLLNGIVYVGFAAHGDNGPWHGWIFGFNAATLAQTGAYCASPNGTGAGFWMSGAGLAADQLTPATKPFGRMFVPTGNGDYNATAPYSDTMDYGDSHLNLDLSNGVPTVTDEFTTNKQAILDAEDGDVASGGLMVVPTQTTGPNPHLAVQAGKAGTLFLLNRDNMGGYNLTADQVLQEIPYAVGGAGVWSSPAYWNGNVYYWGQNDYLKSFPLVDGVLSTTPTESSEVNQYPGSTPSISANGATQGIVWTLDDENYYLPGPAILQAHNASNVATTLYTSNSNASRDSAGDAVKFTVPTVVNGKVYVGTATELDVYGLLAGTALTSTPTFTPGSESFPGSVTVSIADATPASTIYYTTDGSAPTPASTLYTQPLLVTSTETINAIATATGYITSNAASATFTNSLQANAVTFSLPTGTYTSVQSLVLSDGTTGATIYYTTNGTTPTASSTLYTGPISIGATETVSAIAIAPGVSNSPIISNTYTLDIGATGISYPAGFAGSDGFVILNGSTQLNDTRLQLTDGLVNEAGSAWYIWAESIQQFTNDFTFQLSNPGANGITFTIQNSNPNIFALGASGSSLGYAPIPNSVAIKFDFTTPVGSGTDSTGLYINGAVPTVPAIDLSTSGINLASDDEMAVHMVYNGTVLTMTITDMVTSAVWTNSWTINIPATIGSTTAFLGFTGSTNATAVASQKILTWSFVSSAPSTAPPTPTFSPAAGSYTSAQNVTISDATPGATIYYTTNGSTPTTSSAVYSAAIPVSATETLQAIAVSSGLTSAVGSAAYTITPPAATPTFSPAAGSYTSAQNVTISDSTPSATIYYTTNGSTPTTSSAVYSAAIPVSASETLSAIAVATGFSTSAVASAAYTITPPAATPTFSIPAGTYTTTQNVVIGDSTPSATIYYTTNGSTPTTSSAVYSAAIPVSVSETLSAIAVAAGFSTSAVASAAYTITPPAATPTFSIPAGTYTTTQNVVIGDSTPGATIYYTTNGSTPTTSSAVYSAAIPVSASETLSAIAVATGHSTSAVASAAYIINTSAQTATPTFSLAAGNYNLQQTVTIADTTPGAIIYYTLNEATPTTSSTRYTGPIAIKNSHVLEAIAVAPGFTASSVNIAAYVLYAGTPVISLPSGTYAGAQTVTLTSSTPTAGIFYTTNGGTPTASSTPYTGPITVAASETVKAFAAETGFISSPVVQAAYTITPAPATPTFSPAAGTYTSAQSVTISDKTSGATIYYTTNGSTPTASSSIYSTAVQVSASETLNAIAVASGASSSVGSAAYTITPPAATPAFSIPAGTYTSTQNVILSDATPGATIYYTTNGSTPTTSSAVYSAAIPVSASETLNAIAVASGYSTSAVASAAYTITPPAATPAFSIPGGTYTSTQNVILSDATPGATIYYTTNGSTPTTSSAVYSAAIPVSASETLNAIAVASGYSTSAVGSAAYTINSATQTALPTFLEAPGVYQRTVNVQIADTTPGAVIYYTTNGTTPTTSSALYSSFVPVSSTETLMAIAVAPGYSNSGILSGTFTIAPYAAMPTMSVPPGTYTGSVSVALSDTTPGATIYYTIDQSTPTTSSPKYNNVPIPISGSVYLQAIAVAPGYTQSFISAGLYNVNP